MAQIAADPSSTIRRLQESGLLLDRAFVGGEWIEANDGGTFPVHDPATGEELAHVPRLGVSERRRAIDAAAAAYPGWRATLAKERAWIMRRWSDLLLELKYLAVGGI